MASLKRVTNLLAICLCLAKITEAVPKKYDAQAEGSSVPRERVINPSENATYPCLVNCGEWQVMAPEEVWSIANPGIPLIPNIGALPLTPSSEIRVAMPKSSSTYPENPWRRNFAKDKLNETFSDNASDRSQRLGYTTGLGSSSSSNYGYGGVNGYGYSGSGVSAYPYKVDLGGVVLGAIVGIGALILIPKVLGVIAAGHGGYGGYGAYRNIDELNGVSDMMSKLDDFLSKNNVDSTACMQKAVCHYIRNSSHHSSSGSANQVEEMILALSENAIVDYMIDGTAIKEALTNGRNGSGRDCDIIYSNCPLDRDGAMQLIRKFLPFGRT